MMLRIEFLFFDVWQVVKKKYYKSFNRMRDWEKEGQIFFLFLLFRFFFCSSSRGLEIVASLSEQHTQPMPTMRHKNKKIYIETQFASFFTACPLFFLFSSIAYIKKFDASPLILFYTHTWHYSTTIY